MSIKKFTIEYFGKSYPDRLPSVQSIIASDDSRAREWSRKQLETWKIDPEKVRIVVTERLDQEGEG